MIQTSLQVSWSAARGDPSRSFLGLSWKRYIPEVIRHTNSRSPRRRAKGRALIARIGFQISFGCLISQMNVQRSVIQQETSDRTISSFHKVRRPSWLISLGSLAKNSYSLLSVSFALFTFNSEGKFGPHQYRYTIMSERNGAEDLGKLGKVDAQVDTDNTNRGADRSVKTSDRGVASPGSSANPVGGRVHSDHWTKRRSKMRRTFTTTTAAATATGAATNSNIATETTPTTNSGTESDRNQGEAE